MSRLPPDIDQCCAVIVTWQPDLDAVTGLINELCEQQCTVQVIDNGSANAQELAARLTAYGTQVHLESWPDNRGLAAGLNAGLLTARAQGFRFVFLFDQDSRISGQFCQGLLLAWQQAERLTRPPVRPLAAIGPRLMDPQTGRKTPFRCFRWLYRSDAPVAPCLYETDFLITSGTLLSVAALGDIGMMKDSYFIDNIDLEWSFRAKAKGYALYGTDRAVLYHRIGEASNNLLVKAGVIVEHSPLRSYYSTRNRLHLRRQNYAPLDWKVRDAVRFVLKTLWLLLTDSRRAQFLRQIGRGIKDSRTLL